MDFGFIVDAAGAIAAAATAIYHVVRKRQWARLLRVLLAVVEDADPTSAGDRWDAAASKLGIKITPAQRAQLEKLARTTRNGVQR